ncbi:MAG TPA: helix-turn-helix domain-containing protein [Candidatus Acidoferrales bacterium]|nr:helix-turn-helix domain-containing protein [Candidatus Acidoferrales bacterium]
MPASAIAAANAAGSPFARVSTDGIKISERREFWRMGTSAICGPHEIELLGNRPFSADFEHAEVSTLVFSRLNSRTPHRAVRTSELARRDDRQFVKAVLLTKGSCTVEQNGRAVYLRPGEWSIYDTTQPYRMTLPGRAEMFLVLVPRDRFVGRNFGMQNLVARRLRGRAGLGKLIWNLISDTFDQIPDIQDRSGDDVADIVIQVMRLALLDASGDRSPVDAKATLRDRIKLYIINHLADPELSLAKLASVAGCTKRYLHMVFHGEEASIRDYILKQRLERCRADLLNPACARRSITDIAYSWGFNNSNHFSRCFKQTFGASPKHLRAERAPWFTATAKKNPTSTAARAS